jgi:uncharacterized coiled-coil protein SlyX
MVNTATELLRLMVAAGGPFVAILLAMLGWIWKRLTNLETKISNLGVQMTVEDRLEIERQLSATQTKLETMCEILKTASSEMDDLAEHVARINGRMEEQRDGKRRR